MPECRHADDDHDAGEQGFAVLQPIRPRRHMPTGVLEDRQRVMQCGGGDDQREDERRVCRGCRAAA